MPSAVAAELAWLGFVPVPELRSSSKGRETLTALEPTLTQAIWLPAAKKAWAGTSAESRSSATGSSIGAPMLRSTVVTAPVP
ncbi:hypothetical protein D3C72_929260 [compost metagenome]